MNAEELKAWRQRLNKRREELDAQRKDLDARWKDLEEHGTERAARFVLGILCMVAIGFLLAMVVVGLFLSTFGS